MRFLIPIAVVALVIGCGGGEEEETLTLRGGDFTTDEFRIQMRAFLTGIDAQSFCASLDGLSNAEVAETLKAVNERNNVTPKQSPDPSDEATAGGIVKDECARIN